MKKVYPVILYRNGQTKKSEQLVKLRKQNLKLFSDMRLTMNLDLRMNLTKELYFAPKNLTLGMLGSRNIRYII